MVRRSRVRNTGLKSGQETHRDHKLPADTETSFDASWCVFEFAQLSVCEKLRRRVVLHAQDAGKSGEHLHVVIQSPTLKSEQGGMKEEKGNKGNHPPRVYRST